VRTLNGFANLEQILACVESFYDVLTVDFLKDGSYQITFLVDETAEYDDTQTFTTDSLEDAFEYMKAYKS
jgi:hypothetical protein